jgi:4-hydroxy-tetrahydrodipicolinate reductase
MKIAIIGYGKMGKMVEHSAMEQGYEITVVVDPLAEETKLPSGAPLYRSIADAGGLGGAEAAIEFTRPDTALGNIKALAERKMPAVIGTTGWHEHLEEARQAVKQAGSSLIWAPNFSLGVNIFFRIAWYAAGLADAFPEYDVGGFEAHHNKKLDSPSGTAKTLVDGVLARTRQKHTVVWNTPAGRPQPEELHFPSLRLGSVPGQHSVFFDSPADSIEITHTARNREGFASGALRAAGWLTAPEVSGFRKGFFTIDDMLQDILG